MGAEKRDALAGRKERRYYCLVEDRVEKFYCQRVARREAALMPSRAEEVIPPA